MTSKRRWSLWPRRFIEELNPTSGFASLGGAILTIISFVGWNASSGPMSVVFGVLGIVVITLAIAIAALKAIPPALRNAADYVGQRLNLDKLDQIDPPLPKLGIVGPGMVGKSTLLSRILQQAPPQQRTQEVHFFIAVLQTSPIRYLAMLDGPGQMFAGQFEIASYADILCIILDHNGSDQEKLIDRMRIQTNLEFQEQLRDFLAKRPRKPSFVHLLLNKRDLWGDVSVPQADQLFLRNFLVDEEQKWKHSNLAKEVNSVEYSNFRHDDIVAPLDCIFKHLHIRP
ncbi:MAG: GTPase domain-containing protein [Cyanobium sp.]